MAEKTSISWTQATWNCVTGCSKVSPGCANCYAEQLAITRLVGKPGYPGLPWTPENAAINVVLRPERLNMPLKWRTPKMIFTNSMSDLFHELVPDDFILQVFDVMNRCTYNGGANLGRIRDEERSGHVFQVLTKRPERMAQFVNRLRFDHETGLSLDGPGFPYHNKDIWLGTSVENARWRSRLDALRAIEAPVATRFVSFEPLLGSLIVEPGVYRISGQIVDPTALLSLAAVTVEYLNLSGINWVIVGAESGADRRPFDMAWAREIRGACQRQGTAFFFKQADAFRSGHHPYLTEEDGTCWEWHQYPNDLRKPVLVHTSMECAEYGVKQESLSL